MDNRRTTIVINKKFQYQYSLLIVALAVLLVNGFLIMRMLVPGEQPLSISSGMAIGIAIIEMVLVGSIWYFSLKASHRIAGPVYVFARELSKLGEGDLTARINLRDKDMFQPEADSMNKSITALSTRVAAARGMCDQLQRVHSEGGDIGPILDKLAEEMSVFTFGNDQ